MMEGPNNNNKENVNRKYYGIYIPAEDQAVSNDKCCVVGNLKEVMEIFKRNPHARFKPADSEEEAWFLAQDRGSDAVATTETQVEQVSGPFNDAKTRSRKGRRSLSALDCYNKNSPVSLELRKKLVGEEKDTRFPTPKVQELTQMAREIMVKNLDALQTRVKNNPKVLITDCDTPQHLQIACRYNAFHIAAKSDSHSIISFILNTVSSKSYMTLLYPNDSTDTINDRIKYVVDGYLNTPDKMAHETPLHFATKFLCVNAAKVLLSHPWCKTDALNIYKESPFDLIGNRADSKAADFNKKKQEIVQLFKNQYLVPIWRDMSSLTQPVVGEVVMVRDLNDRLPKCLMKDFPDFDLSLLGSCSSAALPRDAHNRTSDLVFEEDSRWEIKGFCGPTSKEIAEDLYDHLKLTSGHSFLYPGSPARTSTGVFNSRLPLSPEPAVEASSPQQRTPPQRNFRTPPTSPFSPMSQRYQQLRDSPISAGPKDISTRRRDAEKGLERIARKFAGQVQVPWSEEWRFLNFYGDILSDEGLSVLEEHFTESLNKSETSFNYSLSSVYSEDSFEDDSEEDVLSGDECWHSPCPSITEEFFECIGDAVFIHGNKLSKHDHQLFDVIKENEDAVVYEKFPMVFQWFNTMKSLGQGRRYR